MSREVLDLDLILNGEVVDASGRHRVELAYEQGLTVRIPQLHSDDLETYVEQARAAQRELDRLTIREIAEFLRAIGQQWTSNESPWRQYALQYAPRFTGYHHRMMANDYFLMGEFLSAPSSVYDQFVAEFGNEHICDEWIPLQASYVRAFGRGVVVHILVGNLPLAGLYSLVRGAISRNANLAKLPTRDPISAYAFVRSMIDADPDHPITKAMSLAYWERDAAVGEEVLRQADAVVVWGGGDSVSAVARQAAGTPIVAFGPRWSLSVVDLDALDEAGREQAALRLMFDTSYYDQEACFSSQRALVRGDVVGFAEALARAGERFSRAMPLVTDNRDLLAHRSATLLEAQFHGWKTWQGGDAEIVLLPEGAQPSQHPLTRTVFLQEIDDLNGVRRHLDRQTQTLAVYPWIASQRFRDEWAHAGAERIVELGMSRHPRQGFSHDGMRWLHHLMRIVSVERPSSQLYRYNTVSGDMAEWIFEQSLRVDG